ncbi:MAG: YiiX/YebB-like N1pC/P60 family cysteine hydrolase [Bacteroides sp.]|jgi:hypothetical protein|nr:YiiX/YebB-like N1pC/P60 family cysteine hydrolase [Bacteroides sp.]
MKTSALFARLALLCFLLMSGIASCSLFSGKEEQNPGYQLSQEELALLQPGDLILRQGFGVVSQAIREYLDEDIRVSHVALLSLDPKDGWQVVQSISQRVSKVDGVQKQDLPSFVSESETNSILVVRFKGYCKEPGLNLRVEEAGLKYLEQEVPFDHSFSLEDSTRFFCSELIWRIFLKEAGVDIFEKMNKDVRKERLQFASFFDPEHFEVIIDHHPLYDSR